MRHPFCSAGLAKMHADKLLGWVQDKFALASRECQLTYRPHVGRLLPDEQLSWMPLRLHLKYSSRQV